MPAKKGKKTAPGTDPTEGECVFVRFLRGRSERAGVLRFERAGVLCFERAGVLRFERTGVLRFAWAGVLRFDASLM